MTIDLSIHPDRRLAYFRFHGDTDVAEGAAAFRSYVDHPDFDPGLVMLSNAAQIGTVRASFTSIVMGVERLLPRMLAFRHPAHSIIFAPDDVPFGVARMIQQLTEPVSRIRYQIVRNAAEALALAGQSARDFGQLHRQLGLLGPVSGVIDEARTGTYPQGR